MAVHRSRPGWTLALTSVAVFMTALDALVVITALPAIHHDIGGNLAALEWAVNAYLLAFAAGIITATALGDRLGRRRVYTIGLLLFTAGSAACALAPTADILIAARAIQGIGAAIVTPLSLTILSAAFPAERRGATVGIWGGIAGLAVAAGPRVGGAVTQGLNWHWIFWVNVPIGLVAAALSRVRLVESHGPASRLDVPGVVLVSGGSVGIVWSLVRANDAGWGSAEVVATLGVGVLLMGGFLVWERRASAPMLPLRLFKIQTFTAASATAF
jgi:EmrB/QacA subfamily drug resistance transporter